MEEKSFNQRLYESHHKKNRIPGFSILKQERGEFFSRHIGQGKRVLDLGCRDGALTQTFLSGNMVTGVDVDNEALKRAEILGIKPVLMDVYGPWKELDGEQFDAIVAGEILEHLFIPEEIVLKVKQHLVKGGIFLGSVPNAFSLINRLRYLKGSKKYTPLSDPTHINHFSLKDLSGVISSVFPHTEIEGAGRMKGLIKISPNLFAFDLIFVAHNK